MVIRSVSTLQQPLPTTSTAHRRAVVQALAAQIVAAGEGRLRVALDGRTASGKTSLGHEIAVAVEAAGRPVLRAGLDDFKKPWSERHLDDRESGEGYYRNAYDYPAARRLLLEPAGPHGSGHVVLCHIDPLTQRRHDDAVVHAARDVVLIVDGVFAGRPELADLWDLRIWVDVPSGISIARGTVRDAGWAGQDAERLHRERYGPSEELYLREVDPVATADVVVDNTAFPEPILVRGAYSRRSP